MTVPKLTAMKVGLSKAKISRTSGVDRVSVIAVREYNQWLHQYLIFLQGGAKKKNAKTLRGRRIKGGWWNHVESKMANITSHGSHMARHHRHLNWLSHYESTSIDFVKLLCNILHLKS